MVCPVPLQSAKPLRRRPTTLGGPALPEAPSEAEWWSVPAVFTVLIRTVRPQQIQEPIVWSTETRPIPIFIVPHLHYLHRLKFAVPESTGDIFSILAFALFCRRIHRVVPSTGDSVQPKPTGSVCLRHPVIIRAGSMSVCSMGLSDLLRKTSTAVIRHVPRSRSAAVRAITVFGAPWVPSTAVKRVRCNPPDGGGLYYRSLIRV